MKINKNGALIEGMYLRAAPGDTYTSFEDTDGATITMNSATILALAELIQFDAKNRGYAVLSERVTTAKECCGGCTHMDPKEICRHRKSPVYSEYVNPESLPCEGECFTAKG